MLTIMMRHVSSHSLMITIMADLALVIIMKILRLESAGPIGNALGRCAHLKTKTVAVTSVGRNTAGTMAGTIIPALTRRFARSGTLVIMITIGTRGAGKLKIALRAWLMKYQLMLRKTLGTLSTW